MDITQIMRHLPHRYPFLLIDRVTEIVPGESLVALKNVTINEPFFPGHFPHHPVMPGVLILESLAQASGILSFESMQTPVTEDTVVYFVGIDNARFRGPVGPGDQLRLETRVTKRVRGIWKYACRALVNGELVCEADIMCTVKELH